MFDNQLTNSKEYVYGRLNGNNGQVLVQQDFDNHLFYDFIEMFTNLEQLQLFQVDTVWNDADIHRIRRLMPNLKRFASSDSSTNLVNAIINSYGHQLECLGLSNQDCRNIDSRLEFSELQELSLMSPSFEVANHIVSTTKKLERFGVSMDSHRNMTDEQMLNLLIGTMKNQKFLDYIGFDVRYSSFVEMTDIIISALSSTQSVYRSEFKIGLNVMRVPEEEKVIEIANQTICRFIDVFTRSNVESYMIDLGFYSDGQYSIDDKRQRGKMMTSLKRTHLARCETKFDRRQSIRFIISNPKCKINGYRAKWLLYN